MYKADLLLHRINTLIVAFLALVLVGSVSFAQSSGSDTATQTADQTAALDLDEDEKMSQEELEQLVAPIALYQDSLLSQVLMASTYPLEVVEADRWVKANPDVKGDALEDAMSKQDWDPSVSALTAFPTVLDMMNADLGWTQQLGDAFLAQQDDVLAAVQTLRKQAEEAGNLESNENIKYEEQEVTTESGSTTTVIVAEPTNPEVVYVPTYNPTVVYGTWRYPSYPPYYYYPPGYNAARGLFWFSVGYAVGNNWWGGCNWGRNNVKVNVNVYNRNKYVKRKRNVNNNNWNHNPRHRKAVPYRNNKVANRHGVRTRDNKRVQSRENFRGRADAGRKDLAKQPRNKRPDQALKNQKRQSAAKKGPDRKKAATRPAAKKQPAKRPATKQARPAQSKKQSAYKGSGKGSSVKRQGNRGAKSRSANHSRKRPPKRGGGGGRRR